MKIFIKAVIVSGSLFVLMAAALVADGLVDNTGKSDVIVILGNKVEADGTPSARLKSRLDKAVELYQQDLSPRILVSGGVGTEGFDEAHVMKMYLVGKKIPADVIFEDNQGIDSYETARNTKVFLDEKGLHSGLVVTNYYHISRTRLALKKAGIHEVYSVHANYFELRDLYSIPREVVGYIYYLIK